MLYLKWIVSFIFCSFTGFSFALVNPESYPGVVQLVGQTVQGTGIFITPDTLLTVHHVTEEGPLYFIDDSTGEIVFTRVLDMDENNDLALLKVVNIFSGQHYESEDFYPINFLDETETGFFQEVISGLFRWYSHREEIGELVTIPGFPQGSFNVVQGVITDHGDIGEIKNVRIVTVTDQTDQSVLGISGAPAFFEGKRLMGVAALEAQDDSHKKLMIGVIAIEKLRALIGRKEDTGISLSEKQEIIETAFNMFVENK